jgi:hypothetical protein
MRIPVRTYRLALLVLAACSANSGCGSGKEKVVSVAGQVTHQGNPVPGLIVSFVPQEQTAAGVSTGATDDHGHYKLKVAKTGESGAVVGRHKAWVSIPRKPPEGADKDKRRERPADTEMTPAMAEILKKYGNLETTPLIVEVKADQPQDIKLD